MARAALQLGVRETAELAKVSPTTITRLEAGEELKPRTVEAVQRALEAAGVEFIDENGGGPGVRLRRTRQPPWSVELLHNIPRRPTEPALDLRMIDGGSEIGRLELSETSTGFNLTLGGNVVGTVDWLDEPPLGRIRYKPAIGPEGPATSVDDFRRWVEEAKRGVQRLALPDAFDGSKDG